jgi:phosphoribosylglycinamide formyltransferase 1
MHHIAIFASGSGSNAENIIRYFSKSNCLKVVAVFSENADAYALTRAKNLGVDAYVFSKNDLNDETKLLAQLKNLNIDFIVLAGFLKLIPKHLTEAYQKKIINIHPALLPDYGGKGMYGSKVHQAVKAAGEKETGITIHYVNSKYDEGEIIFQKSVEVEENDTADSIAQKVHALEYKFFPVVIEHLLCGTALIVE